VIHTCTHVFDHAGDFVTRNNREAHKWKVAMLDHQIAMADATGANTDQHFTVNRYRDGAVLKLDFAWQLSWHTPDTETPEN
jgi:hypothetical protein